MPTIIAICPYCRSGGVRAAANAIGANATCPKCKNSFTVLPEKNLPEWAANANPNVNSFSAPTGERSKLAEETRSTAHMPDVTEPSPVLPAEKSRKTKETKEKPKEEKPETGGGNRVPSTETPKSDAESKPKPEPTGVAAATVTPPTTSVASSVAEESDDEPTAPRDMGMVFALLALILVGPAALVSQLPYGRFIALPFLAVGLIGGLLSLGAEGKARLAGAGAAFMHFVLLIMVLFLPSWLALDPWRGPVVEEPKGPQAVEHGTNKLAPVTPNDWLDAGKYSWQFRDARVTVKSAVGPVELNGPKGEKRTTKTRYLYLTLQVQNVGFDREIPLSGWAAGQSAEGVRVTDAEGKQLELAKFDEGWSMEARKPSGRAMPGHVSETLLIFTAPPAKTDFVRVQLSGTALGVQDEIKFRTGTVGVLPYRGPSVPGTP